MRFNDMELIGVGVGSLVLFLFAGDWLIPVSILTLWACLKLTSTGDRLYVLPLAMTFQWSQTSLGVFYQGLTGRTVPAIELSDYRPMVLIALACVLVLSAGIKAGLMVRKPPDPAQPRPDFAFSFGPLIIAYVTSVFVEGTLLTIAPNYPSLRQIITTLDTARLGVLFLIMRRLCSPTPRWATLAMVVSVEVVMGITGFFAGFREPIVLAVLAVLEIFDHRNKAALGGDHGGDRRREHSRARVDGHPQGLPQGVRRGRSVFEFAQHARAAGQRPDLGLLQERPGRGVGDRRHAGRPDVDRLLSCPGHGTGAERPSAHQRRDPERRSDAHRHAAGVLSKQARAHVGQREGSEILQRARRRARIEHEHRVRLLPPSRTSISGFR